jgi:hypothetical protein
MDAKQLMGLLQKQEEETQAIQALWKTLFPKLEAPDESQCFIWLDGRNFEDVVDGLKAAAKKHNAHRQKIECGEDLQAWDRPAAMKFASACMLSLGIDRMTDDEKAEHLSKIRSEAGKRGARVKWVAERDKARKSSKKQQPNSKTENSEVVSVCQPLPSVLPLKVKVDGSGSNLGLDLGRDAGSSEAENPSSRLTSKSLVEPKPQTKTNSSRKSAPDGTPYPDGFDAWTNVQRTEWLMHHGLKAGTSAMQEEKTKNQNPPNDEVYCMTCGLEPVRSKTSDYCINCWESRPKNRASAVRS